MSAIQVNYYSPDIAAYLAVRAKAEAQARDRANEDAIAAIVGARPVSGSQSISSPESPRAAATTASAGGGTGGPAVD